MDLAQEDSPANQTLQLSINQKACYRETQPFTRADPVDPLSRISLLPASTRQGSLARHLLKEEKQPCELFNTAYSEKWL